MTKREKKMRKALELLKEFLNTLTVPVEKLKPYLDEIDEALK